MNLILAYFYVLELTNSSVACLRIMFIFKEYMHTTMNKSYPEKQLRNIKRKRRLNILKSAFVGVMAWIIASIFIAYYGNNVIKSTMHLVIALALVIVGIISFVLMSHFLAPSAEELKFNSGIEGEKTFKKYLSKVDGYKLYSVPLPHGGDIDAVLINQKGVFAFEVKNYTGIIKCNSDKWTRTKIGQGGGRYEGYVGNPSEEAKRHTHDLKQYLRRRGIAIGIVPVVVITAQDAQLRCDNCSVPVIKSYELKKLLNRRRYLSIKECKIINKEILQLI